MSNGRRSAQRLWRGPVLAWVALLVLFAINLGSAFVSLGSGNIILNLCIAALMAIVLATFLMDLRSSQVLIRIVAVAGLFWMMLMFALTFSDYLSRS